MKKMIAIFFSGCALIGLGLGITVMELYNWKVSDVRTDLLEAPLQNYREEIDINMDSTQSVEIDSRYYRYGTYTVESEVIYDADYTESLLVEIDYHGNIPRIYHSWWESEDANTHSNLWIDTNNYNDMTSVFDLLHSMFDNKTYYRHGESTHIKKVTVYTAYPDKITIS